MNSNTPKTVSTIFDGTTQPDNFRIIRLNEVCDKVGLSRSTIYKLIKLGKFPSQVDLGGKCSGWAEHEINQWIVSRLNARKNA